MNPTLPTAGSLSGDAPGEILIVPGTGSCYTGSMWCELWPGGPKWKQDNGAFPLSTDSVLLAHFAAPVRAERILDLGCGAGALCVLLHASHPAAEIGGVELRPMAAALCREIFEKNGLDPGRVVTGDLREHRALWGAGRFGLVVSNPPYFPENGGAVSPDEARGLARSERECTLDELTAAGAYLCRNGGAFALVHRPERLCEIFRVLTAHGFEPKRLRFVHHTAGHAPSLVLIEARRGGRPGLTVEKPLLLRDGDGGESFEYRRIYHRG